MYGWASDSEHLCFRARSRVERNTHSHDHYLKYRSSNVVRNTVARYANRAGNLLILFFLTPYLLSKLGADMLGLQVMAFQAMQFCILLGSACGMGYSRFATVHYGRADYAKMNETLGRGLSLTSLILVAVAAVIATLAVFAEQVLNLHGEVLRAGRTVILIIGAGYLFDQLTEVWGSPLFMSQRIYVGQIGQLAARVLSTVAVVTLFAFSTPSIVKWVSLTVVSTVLVKLLYVLPAARRAVPQAAIRFKSLKGHEFREMTHFSAASLFVSLGMLLYYASSSIVISNLPSLGVAKVVAYNLGQRWDPQVRELALGLALALTPVFTNLYAQNDKEGLQKTYLLNLRYAFLLCLLPVVLLFVYAKPLIGLWIGAEYMAESGVVLQLSMLNVIASVPYIIGYEVLAGLGQIRRVAWVNVIGGLANIALGLILATYGRLGLTGVALGMLLTHGILLSSYVIGAVNRKLGIPLRRLLHDTCFRPAIVGIAIIVPSCLLFQLSPPATWPQLLMHWTGCSLAYAGAAWFLGLSAQDRSTLRAVFARRFSRQQSSVPDPSSA